MIPVETGAACSFEDVASSGGCCGVNIGPEYAGGGASEGTVKAFIPGRSGRRVAGDGLVRRLVFRGMSLLWGKGFRSSGPLDLGAASV